VLAHGGMGYAKEYDVERYMREAMIARIAPVSREMILNFISERVLGPAEELLSPAHALMPQSATGVSRVRVLGAVGASVDEPHIVACPFDLGSIGRGGRACCSGSSSR
jgi:hypothetical protein